MARKKENLISLGKRKRAIARVVVKTGEGKFTVNGHEPLQYFGNHPILLKKIMAALAEHYKTLLCAPSHYPRSHHARATSRKEEG